MFGTIRKHQTWLWVIIIIIICFSFLVFFSPDARLTSRGGEGGGNFGSIQSLPVPEAEGRAIQREVYLAHFLRSGNWPGNDEQTTRSLENETLSRAFLVRKLKEMGIEPSEKAVAMLVHEQIRDLPLKQLEEQYLSQSPLGLTAVDYDRFVRHEVGIRQLVAAASVSAKLVNASEAEVIYRKENQATEAQLALFWATNYQDKVVITNGAIGAFYTNRMFLYRVPEKTILAYVEFTSTNYFAEADKQMATRTNLDAAINEQFFQRDTNKPFWKDDAGTVLSEEASKKKIRETIREEFALLAARRAAAEFGGALMEPKTVPGLDPNANNVANLDKLAALRGLAVKVTKPFDANSGLEEFDAPTNAAPGEETLRSYVRKQAAELKDTNPIRFNGIPGPHAVYIIARKGAVPSEMPPLEKVTDKVTQDYKNNQAQELARKAGATFGTNVTNGLTLGKSFADICAAEGVKPLDVPPFSDSTESLTNFDARINLRMLQNLSRDLEVSKATPFLPFSQEGGLVLHLKSRPKLDDAKVQAALPEFMARLRIYRQNESFNQWFRKQADQAKLALPKREEPKPPKS